MTFQVLESSSGNIGIGKVQFPQEILSSEILHPFVGNLAIPQWFDEIVRWVRRIGRNNAAGG